MEAVPRLARHVRDELGRVIVGQHELKTQCLIVLLCDGHALLEGVPGIAKTLTVKALARLLGLDFQRVQCTSDLMPADIVGTNVANLSTGTFQLHKGPAFTDLLLVDEVNRMPPRTRRSCMEGGRSRSTACAKLSSLFTVFATPESLDFEGTYPLPGAARPLPREDPRPLSSSEEETQLLITCRGSIRAISTPLASPRCRAGLRRARSRRVAVERSLFDYIVKLVRLTREWPALSLGASPRAAMSVTRFAKAVAALDGRDYVIPDDAKQAFLPVLRHRVIVKAEADLEGLTADQSLDDVLKAVEVPK
jgi:MoxR-like ATPase